ncbi:MAG: hypothetical protein PHS14_20045, partial [Elusimicrobia bacterium]|nr:hypothetical protein [Elusimicrobiota bacterium]
MLRVLAILLFPTASHAQIRVIPELSLGAASPLPSAPSLGNISLPLMSLPSPSALSVLAPAPSAVPRPAAAVPAALAAVRTPAPSSAEKPVEEQKNASNAMFDGTLSAKPESRSWSLPDGGPLLGRALRPQGYVFGGRRYIDLMNPAAVRLRGADGKPRDFLWVRAVRSGYGTKVGPIGEVATSDYFSDTLLFELRPGRAPKFIERALESTPGRLLEDPRLSRLKIRGRDERGRFKTEERLYLGVTDYSAHAPMAEKSARNAFIPIDVDERGVPRVGRDETGAPKLVELSPEPVRSPDGSFSIVDAKNGVLASDHAGRARMLSRHRYAARDPRLPE